MLFRSSEAQSIVSYAFALEGMTAEEEAVMENLADVLNMESSPLVKKTNERLPAAQVGAALLCADGTVYQGCNIENASYSPTVCAERTAFFKAVYDGHRDFAAIAVCGGKDGVITGAFPPCGVCRQVMREFCGDDFLIYMITPEGCEAHTLAEILPFSFSEIGRAHV